jgi:uncharacterized protein YhaN
VAGYREYQHSRRQKELLDHVITEQKQLLHNYIDRFPLEDTVSAAEALKRIQSNQKRYGQLQEDIVRLQKEIRRFQAETQVEEDAIPVEELQAQQDKLDEEIKEVNQGITQDQEALLQLTDELNLIEDAESRRDVLLEEKLECEYKVELLTKTEEFLNLAKEKFLSAYMKPLRKGIDHYMTLLDESYHDAAATMDFDITMDLSIQVISHGTTHSGDYLSKGYQDLAALCARFALVDVLYSKEKPMIILDDPFTNLDKDKIARALQLLREIGKERQIIYFTCHESRMPS